MSFPTQEHILAAQEAADYWKDQSGFYVWPSVTLAQAAIESANWTKLSGVNNGFGIKATPAQIEAGQATYVWTHEVVKGETVKVKQWFANYASLRDAYVAHAKLLATGKPYAEARKTTTPQEFIRLAGKRYATAPDYAVIIIGVMDRDNLYRYDKAASAAPAPVKPPTLHPAVVATGGGVIGAGAVVAATQALPHISLDMVAALALVAAVVGGLVLLSRREKPAVLATAVNTAAPPFKPAPPLVVESGALAAATAAAIASILPKNAPPVSIPIPPTPPVAAPASEPAAVAPVPPPPANV